MKQIHLFIFNNFFRQIKFKILHVQLLETQLKNKKSK